MLCELLPGAEALRSAGGEGRREDALPSRSNRIAAYFLSNGAIEVYFLFIFFFLLFVVYLEFWEGGEYS